MANNEENAIIAKDLHKSFRLPHEQHSGIKQAVLGLFNRNRKKGYENQYVLKGISFEIKKGEFFGIVGRNGSGKSTLLKLLAGIYVPDSGAVQINGSLTPFIELGVGFNPELTGRENIFLNGALLGFSREQMKAMYSDIVEFAELERFMDQKLKNYSSGMQVRLAFSIAIRARSDILLLDEVLAVGDEAFQRKCYDYFAQLKMAGKTVILVTHDMGSVTRFCDRAMLVNDGAIEYIGSTNDAAKLYEEKNLQDSSVDNEMNNEISDGKIKIKVETIDRQGLVSHRFVGSEKIILKISLTSDMYLSDAFLGLSIHRSNSEPVFVGTTESSERPLPSIEPQGTVTILYEIQNIFAEDTYFVNISIKSNNRTKVYLSLEKVAQFQVAVTGPHRSTFRPDYKVSLIDDQESADLAHED